MIGGIGFLNLPETLSPSLLYARGGFANTGAGKEGGRHPEY